jgi:hypothetical protein
MIWREDSTEEGMKDRMMAVLNGTIGIHFFPQVKPGGGGAPGNMKARTRVKRLPGNSPGIS